MSIELVVIVGGTKALNVAIAPSQMAEFASVVPELAAPVLETIFSKKPNELYCAGCGL